MFKSTNEGRKHLDLFLRGRHGIFKSLQQLKLATFFFCLSHAVTLITRRIRTWHFVEAARSSSISFRVELPCSLDSNNVRMPWLNNESAHPDSIRNESSTTICDTNSSKRKLAVFCMHKVIENSIV